MNDKADKPSYEEIQKSRHEALKDSAVRFLSKMTLDEKRWQYDETKVEIKMPLPKVYDREYRILGITFMDYWPGKPKKNGWNILWHKWNWGCGLFYLPWPQTSHEQMFPVESADGQSIEMFKATILHKRPLWTRILPNGWSFTIARLRGKWEVTRNPDPFLMSSLNSLPLARRMTDENGDDYWLED